MITRIYDTVKTLLTKYPDMRDNDKLLLWAVWSIERNNKVMFTSISKEDFMKCSPSESVTRARRAVQHDFVELRPSKFVAKQRRIKQETQGKFVYNELLQDRWQNE